VSDGKTTLVSRICCSTLKGAERKPASLYFSIGSRFAQCTDGAYRMRQTNMEEDVVIVSSERLTPVTEDWVTVPENHIVLISHKSNVLLFAVDIKAEYEKARLELKCAKKLEKTPVKTPIPSVLSTVPSLTSINDHNDHNDHNDDNDDNDNDDIMPHLIISNDINVTNSIHNPTCCSSSLVTNKDTDEKNNE